MKRGISTRGRRPLPSPSQAAYQTNLLVGLPEMVRFDIVNGRPGVDEEGRLQIIDGELEEPPTGGAEPAFHLCGRPTAGLSPASFKLPLPEEQPRCNTGAPVKSPTGTAVKFEGLPILEGVGRPCDRNC